MCKLGSGRGARPQPGGRIRCQPRQPLTGAPEHPRTDRAAGEPPARRALARPQALRLAARPRRPHAALPRLGPRRRPRAWARFWFFGPVLVFGIFPLLDLAIGMDARNPPDGVIKWLEQDRYYRWCTYLYLPIQYAGLVFACWLWSRGAALDGSTSVGLALTVGDGQRDRHQHRPRARPQAREPRALAEPGRARAERLRALLHRAQPRPPRARGHPRGPRQRAPRRELLRVPAAHGARQPALGLGARARAPAARLGSSPWTPAQRHPQRVGDDGGAVRRAGRGLRRRSCSPTC